MFSDYCGSGSLKWVGWPCGLVAVVSERVLMLMMDWVQ